MIRKESAKKEFAEIALLDCRCFLEPALFDAALERMDGVRRARVAAWKAAEDRRLSLGVGVLARFLMARHGIAPESLFFEEDGKPRVGDGSYISLSHAGDWAMAGLSSAPVAVDVEACRPDEWGIIAARFYTAEERAAMEEAPAPPARFWQLWSRKECLVKRDGLGDRRELPVLEDPPGGRFWDFPLPGYSCVACVGEGLTPALLTPDRETVMKLI